MSDAGPHFAIFPGDAMNSSNSVRFAGPAELERLQHIELSAGRWFAEIGMEEIARDEPFSLSELSEYRDDDRLFVFADDENVPVAYLLVDVVDGCAHIEQVSVHADHAGKKIGRVLIDRVDGWARQRGLGAVTLTTFRDVPWNAPYYQRCGFRILDAGEITPQLRVVRREEARHGLDRWPRVCMRKDLGG